MKYLQYLTAAVLALTLANLTGCKKEPVTGEPMTLRVAGVKGINDFPSNLRFGLFVDSPVNADNVPFSVMPNYQTVFEEAPTWGFDQSVSSRILVYAPFNPAYDGYEESVIEVPLDQSTPELFLSANFMMGTTSGKPGQSKIIVPMEHVMSGMMLIFDNRTGDRLVGCTVSGFMTQGVFDKVTGTMTASGKNRMITPMRSPYGDDVFCFLYLPQEVNPCVYLTFESGRQVTMPFSNSFHEYPGKIISPGVITLTDELQDNNMVTLDGVSINEWSTNTFPAFPSTYPYYNLKTLAQVEPDTSRSGYFRANINKVYVTAVDSNRTNCQGVIIEDSTKATYAWLYLNHKVEAGYSFVGQIEGLMGRSDDGSDYQITRLFLTNATVKKEKELPCTPGDFAAIAQDGVGDWEYRRMQFKDVTVVTPFENGTAVFSQNGVLLPVVMSEPGPSPSAGSKGDIIGFPITVAGQPAVRLFDGAQLGGMKKDYESDAFTRTERPGMYDLSSSDTAVISWDYSQSCQISIRRNRTDRSMQISDLKAGRYSFHYVYSPTEVITAGRQYVVAINEWDTANDSGKTVFMECVKVENDKAWLKDNMGQIGLIISL